MPPSRTVSTSSARANGPYPAPPRGQRSSQVCEPCKTRKSACDRGRMRKCTKCQRENRACMVRDTGTGEVHPQGEMERRGLKLFLNDIKRMSQGWEVIPSDITRQYHVERAEMACLQYKEPRPDSANGWVQDIDDQWETCLGENEDWADERKVVNEVDPSRLAVLAPSHTWQIQFPQTPMVLSQTCDIYFRGFHPVFPILHKTTFQRYLTTYVHGPPDGTLDQIAMLVVVAIAFQKRYKSDTVEFLTSTIDADAIINDWCLPQVPIILNDNSVKSVQVLGLLAAYMYLHAGQPCIEVARYLALQAFMKARSQPLRLHLLYVKEAEQHGKQPMTHREIEMGKRAWWCVMSLVAATGLVLGKQPAIRLEEYAIAFPHPLPDDLLDEADGTTKAILSDQPAEAVRCEYLPALAIFRLVPLVLHYHDKIRKVQKMEEEQRLRREREEAQAQQGGPSEQQGGPSEQQQERPDEGLQMLQNIPTPRTRAELLDEIEHAVERWATTIDDGLKSQDGAPADQSLEGLVKNHTELNHRLQFLPAIYQNHERFTLQPAVPQAAPLVPVGPLCPMWTLPQPASVAVPGPAGPLDPMWGLQQPVSVAVPGLAVPGLAAAGPQDPMWGLLQPVQGAAPVPAVPGPEIEGLEQDPALFQFQ